MEVLYTAEAIKIEEWLHKHIISKPGKIAIGFDVEMRYIF
jgi:hypothetical protein